MPLKTILPPPARKLCSKPPPPPASLSRGPTAAQQPPEVGDMDEVLNAVPASWQSPHPRWTQPEETAQTQSQSRQPEWSLQPGPVLPQLQSLPRPHSCSSTACTPRFGWAPTRVTLVSFAYSVGMPPSYDAVFSALRLHGPRHSSRDSGLNPAVRELVTQCGGAFKLLDQVCKAACRLAETQDNVIVAVGCRYGKHRSVTFVEEAKRVLDADFMWKNQQLNAKTRHLDKW